MLIRTTDMPTMKRSTRMDTPGAVNPASRLQRILAVGLATALTVLSGLPSWAGESSPVRIAVFAFELDDRSAGGGIIGHPGGPAAGVRSMREGWEAAVAGIGLVEHAKTHPALAAAIAAFGKR